ncbi:cell wall hydrolase [Pontiella sp.]|uniref:cell wall hydrolase n=1 Tax=Pontiella sp. TaxID=2837462 RepID=UPI0035686CB4
MSTRRQAAVALVGLPILTNAAEKSKTAAVPPFSEAAARIISYTIYAEARGEPFKGKMAVAAVIQTRARLSGRPLTEVCLQEKQFSCWNELDAVPENFCTGAGIKPADLQARSDCYGIAWVLMSSPRKWEHLTHFYNPDKVVPSWAASLRGIKTIGKHVFGYMD